jgi:hydrogenase 3 maturation protease
VKEFLAVPRPDRVAVIGIGNEMNGDDAVGVRVVRRLAARLGRREDVLLIEAGTAPENFTGPLRRFQPALILLIDAASFDRPPGTTTMISWPDTDGFSASTHTLPPSVFCQYLVAELGCRVALIGIQPAGLDFGRPLSAPVAAAAGRLTRTLGRWLGAGRRGEAA